MAVRTLLGSPWETIKNEEKSVDEMWEFLDSNAQTDNILTAGTHGTSDKEKNPSGLVDGHSYTVIKTVKLSNGVRLVQCRNPWGNDSFKGDWSDQSLLWTPELEKEAGFTNNQGDGLIFMSVEDYHKMFRITWINFDPSKLKRSHFLRLNDDGTGGQ